ncbi:MAG TPA: amidase [Opitutales bacterium]|nr:amidase [Opitutales bacterium]
MTAPKLTFQAWQALALEDPAKIADGFFSRYERLTPESRKALFATHPERSAILQKIKAGCAAEKAALGGLPYVLQDMFDIEGLPTRCGAAFKEPFEALLDDSCLLAQTLGNHGAALLAKSVPSEFGWDMKGHNPSFGDCPHARGLRYVCGGGAGASIHAVADGWAPIAFGLDTCGGIRIPAAFHGLFGFRMENNNYARDGVFPLVPSLDAVGWVTADIDDLLSSLEVFYRFPDDATNLNPRGYLLKDSLQGISPESKAGLMQLTRPLDIDDEPAVSKMLAKRFQPASRAFRVIQNRELYSIHQHWVEEYRNYYDPHLLKRIEAGRSYSPAESEEAAIAQQNIRASLIGFFRDYDYLLMPISPLASPEKSEWDRTLEEELLQLNAPLSLSFLPALILPYSCGGGKYNAAQMLVNPRKLQLLPRLLEQLRQSYA